MKSRKLSCNRDWTGITVFDERSGQHTYLGYDEIEKIQLDPCQEVKLFRRIVTEKIQIILKNKKKRAIEILKVNEQTYFEEYKLELEKFASDNKIPFINNIML